jgi:hypothetical protein
MATTPANLMQTAINGAVTLTSAFVTAGFVSDIDEARAAFEKERDAIFAKLQDQPNDQPVRAASSGGGSTSGSRSGGKQFTAEEARAIDLAFGKFKGVTLGELEGFDGDKCAEYGYGEGEKSGLGYLKYLANNDDPKGSFIKRAATAVLEDRRAQAA